MTDEEKVARLAAILGIEGAVQYGRFRGYGERSDKRGYREARIGGLAGDGPTDDAALRRLVVTLERQADYEPTRAAYSIASIREQAKGARIREASARAEAERLEGHANDCEKEAASVAAQYAVYLADRGTEGAS